MKCPGLYSSSVDPYILPENCLNCLHFHRSVPHRGAFCKMSGSENASSWITGYNETWINPGARDEVPWPLQLFC